MSKRDDGHDPNIPSGAYMVPTEREEQNMATGIERKNELLVPIPESTLVELMSSVKNARRYCEQVEELLGMTKQYGPWGDIDEPGPGQAVTAEGDIIDLPKDEPREQP